MRAPFLLLALYWLALLPLFVVWLRTDQLFAPWDHAGHASMVMRLHDGILAGNPWRFYELSKFYPPLFHLLAVPASFVSTHPDAFCFGNWLALLALLWSTFLLGRTLVGPSAGFAAALLVPAYPYVTIMGRMPMTDLSVTAAVAWTLALLCDGDPLATPRAARRLGLAIALGMLAKWSYVFFTALPLLAVVIRHAWARRRRRATATIWPSLGRLALWPLVLAGPWYVRSVGNLLAQSSWQFGSGVRMAEGEPDPLSMASLLYYWPILRAYYVGDLIAIALAAGVVAISVAWSDRESAPIAPRASWTPLFLSLLGGAVCLVLVTNKDVRYPLPLVPSLAVVSAAAIAFVRDRLRVPALVACALLGWLMAWHSLFRIEPPDPTDWKVPAVAGSIAAAVRSSAGDAPLRVLVLPNDAQMNFTSLRYALELALRDGAGKPRKVEVDRIEDTLDAARLATYERAVVVWPPPAETIVSRGSVAGAHFVLEQSGWTVETRMVRGDGREIRVMAPPHDPVAPLSASSAGTSRRSS